MSAPFSSRRMIARRRRSAGAAFSLVEVVLAIGIVSFGLIAVVGLIPVGLGALRSAVDDTSTSLILQDVREQLAQLQFTNQDIGPLYYDAEGSYLGTASDPRNLYRVDISIASLHSQNAPAHTDLLSAKVLITWPVTDGSTVPAGNKNRSYSSFYVTPVSGPSWDTLGALPQRKIDL